MMFMVCTYLFASEYGCWSMFGKIVLANTLFGWMLIAFFSLMFRLVQFPYAYAKKNEDKS